MTPNIQYSVSFSRFFVVSFTISVRKTSTSMTSYFQFIVSFSSKTFLTRGELTTLELVN